MSVPLPKPASTLYLSGRSHILSGRWTSLSNSPTMFDKIRRLGTDTALYGISTILGRFLTFLLTPIYTHVLITSDLGVVATVYAYVAFFNVIYGYGMEGAFMKYVSTLEVGNRKQNFSVPFLSVGATSALLSLLILVLRAPLAEIAEVPVSQSVIISYAA